MWYQQQIILKAKSRGFHLIDDEINGQLLQIKNIEAGLLHLFLQHTSASLTINENADPTVLGDLERHFNKFVPENALYYQHDYEGSDDMPAHIKCSTLGCQLTIPISNGQLALGTWQGVYLCEHRNHASQRRVIATLHGE
ncbi:secondary thiamine-phosphate synthase enzyme YjbQ [Thalassotalea psychrophila]|uniref:Secondary thiamine-phosphate synthase enzyme YjbQ n=1 Tax=Thalassotalea psychrophila TaxID=3065647 RepID=A0ABY9TRM7_9GAMM|nr:secondary thiamine-phosphate synthase enzyme YjbQ [Colwelliaceae bacterium SQ149]